MRVRCYRKFTNYREQQEKIPDVRLSSEETQKLTAKLFSLEPQMWTVNRLSHVTTIGPKREQLGLLSSDASAILQNLSSEFTWSGRYLNKRVTKTWLLRRNAHVDVSPASAKWLHLNERGGGWAQPRAGASYCFFFIISNHSNENSDNALPWIKLLPDRLSMMCLSAPST